MAFFDELKDVRKAIAAFKEAQALFEALEAAPIKVDGETLTAVQEAQKLIKQAADHHTVIELGLAELMDPKTAASESARLLKYLGDHGSELSKFLDGAKALVGAEFETVQKIVLDRKAAV